MAQEENTHELAQGYEPGDPWDYEPTFGQLETLLKHINASGETFNPPTINTAESTTKARPYSNVVAFGADYNAGPGDDTQAFADAINATPNGGIIFVPPGHYRVDAGTITLRRGQRLVGVSAENYGANRGSRIIITGTGEYGVRIGDGSETTRGAGVEHVKIENDGDRLDVPYGVLFDGDSGQIHTKLDHVTVLGFDTNWAFNRAWGIHGQGLISTNGNAGFVFDAALTTSVFDNCIDYGSDGWAFDFQGGANSTVMNAARTDGSDNGIRITGSVRSISFVAPEMEHLSSDGTGILMDANAGTMNLENPGFGSHSGSQTYIDIQNCRNGTISALNVSSARAPDNGAVLNVNTENVDPSSIVATAPSVFSNAGDWDDITVLGGTRDNVQS